MHEWDWDDYVIWVAINDEGKVVGYYLLEVVRKDGLPPE